MHMTRNEQYHKLDATPKKSFPYHGCIGRSKVPDLHFLWANDGCNLPACLPACTVCLQGSRDKETSIAPQIRTTSTNKDDKLPRLNHILHFPIPQSHIADIKPDANTFCLTCGDEYFLEPFKLHIWDYDAGDHVLDVHLHHFSAVDGAVVGHGDGGGEG